MARTWLRDARGQAAPRWRLGLLLLALLAAAATLGLRLTQRAPVAFVPVMPVAVDEPLVAFEVFASDLPEVTDLHFVDWPARAGESGRRRVLLVAQKAGQIDWIDVATRQRGVLLRAQVRIESEMGLLGLALSPGFPSDRRLFVSLVAPAGEELRQTQVRVYTVPPSFEALQGGAAAAAGPIVFHLDQPYSNHNGGQIAFGPDGMLYVGLGDGGAGGDPHDYAQNPSELLGKMLRLDVLNPPLGRSYGVPADNPFVAAPGYRPEIWALGLRNPWRFSFDSAGQLWVGDVGQNEVEEVDVVRRGDNLGWNVREGHACYDAERCESEGLRPPRYVAVHPDSVCLTGGFVYEGRAIAALRGRYVFCDYLLPWLRALTTESTAGEVSRDGGLPGKATTVGAHDGLCSTLGRDPDGELWLGDFRGRVLRIVPSTPVGPAAPVQPRDDGGP